MRAKFAALLSMVMMPFALDANPAVVHGQQREGVPFFYQNTWQNQWAPAPVQRPQNNIWVGDNNHPNIIGQTQQTLFLPRPTDPLAMGHMTPNGISMPRMSQEHDIVLSAFYRRSYGDFRFKTGVNSILAWNQMAIEEIGFRAEKDFHLRGVDLFVFGDYSMGRMTSGGLSYDFDLMPFDMNFPHEGIFTVSMGDQDGQMSNLRVGIGARHAWDWNGWKISPMIGYQIFRHNMTMSNHMYPNPGINIPLMGQDGSYIFGNGFGDYTAIFPGAPVPEGWFQVCMSPEDLALAAIGADGRPILDQNGALLTTGYNPLFPNIPWGVGPGQCIVVGGDGMIRIPGTTHIYNAEWSGIFLGVEIEKQLTFTDRLRFFGQISMPQYHAYGIWPHRTDWQQNPSFIDYGNNGALHYRLEMEYIHRLSDRLELSLKADMMYFRVGAIPGELYVAGFYFYMVDDAGNWIPDANGHPTIGYQPPFTMNIAESLKWAVWQSFGLSLGVKYAF